MSLDFLQQFDLLIDPDKNSFIELVNNIRPRYFFCQIPGKMGTNIAIGSIYIRLSM